MRESDYQARLIQDLNDEFPGCFILMNDAGYIQGIPDLLVLFRGGWFALEVKGSARSPIQPNQDWYINRLNEISYAAFIYPENHEVIMNEIRTTFRTRR